MEQNDDDGNKVGFLLRIGETFVPNAYYGRIELEVGVS